MKRRPLSPKSQALKDQILVDLARYRDEPHLQPEQTEVDRVGELAADNVRLVNENRWLWIAVFCLLGSLVIALVLDAVLL